MCVLWGPDGPVASVAGGRELSAWLPCASRPALSSANAGEGCGGVSLRSARTVVTPSQPPPAFAGGGAKPLRISHSSFPAPPHAFRSRYPLPRPRRPVLAVGAADRKSTRLNSSH